jgi:circadian clock protein KaiC
VLRFAAARPTSLGLEVHLSTMLKLIDQFKPQIVVLEPVSSFAADGTEIDARSMLMRLVDLLKSRQITAFFTSLTAAGHAVEQSEVGISSLIDSWLVLDNVVKAGERTRTLMIVKSRGMKHSNQARELLLTDHGAELADVSVGPDGAILTASARVAQDAADRTTATAEKQDTARKQATMARKTKALEAKIAEMRTELAAEAEEVGVAMSEQASTALDLLTSRAAQAQQREQVGGAQRGRANGGTK